MIQAGYKFNFVLIDHPGAARHSSCFRRAKGSQSRVSPPATGAVARSAGVVNKNEIDFLCKVAKGGIRLTLLLFLLLFCSLSAQAQTIHYSVSMPQPATHVFQIEMTIDQPGVSRIDLSLPAWNGLYQIRD